MKQLFDNVSARCSKITTHAYSTSFSLGIHFLDRKLHDPIYAIYGFVRYADEIVDSFHGFDKRKLLSDFRDDAFKAIEAGISLNPILNSFQRAVRAYNIDPELVRTFLDSMEMDLDRSEHDRGSFEDYILGSAEVVGLMCLWIFCDGRREQYEALRQPAMRLGAAFQKVNFLRDLNSDYHDLGRSYFPGLDPKNLKDDVKQQIEKEIERDFAEALEGIRRLPRPARFGVYLAYVYYRSLLEKIKMSSGEKLLKKRLQLAKVEKLRLLIGSYFRFSLGEF